MIRSTHRTIQDYFKPKTVPSKRDIALTERTASFGSVLQGALNRDTPERQSERTGLSVRDYINRPLDAKASRAAICSKNHQNLPGSIPDQNTKASLDEKAVSASQKTAVAAIPQAQLAIEERQAIEHAIQRAAERYDIPSDLIQSVVRCESNFKPEALSHAGAQGLMQLMPATAGDLGVTDPFDIQQNIDGGTRYLRQMLDRFEGDIETALAAYNAGPGTVSRYGGVPPYKETQAYVEKVMRYAARAEANRRV
jgi:soluble lytic murein transglycosylase-like protein